MIVLAVDLLTVQITKQLLESRWQLLFRTQETRPGVVWVGKRKLERPMCRAGLLFRQALELKRRD
jgi:hypothetical protein